MQFVWFLLSRMQFEYYLFLLLHRDSDDGRSRVVDRNTFDRRSLAQFTMTEFSDRGSGSIRAESVAASRMERALSEVASSLNSSFAPRHGTQQSWLLQAQIWLQLGKYTAVTLTLNLPLFFSDFFEEAYMTF